MTLRKREGGEDRYTAQISVWNAENPSNMSLNTVVMDGSADAAACLLVKQLVDKGYLVKKDNEVRTLRVVGQKTSDSLLSQEDLREQNWRLLLENVQLRKKLKQFEKY